MPQLLTFSDHTGDTFTADMNVERRVLADGTVSHARHPSELAAFVAVASQMFYDHEVRFEEEEPADVMSVRALFDKMREVVRCRAVQTPG